MDRASWRSKVTPEPQRLRLVRGRRSSATTRSQYLLADKALGKTRDERKRLLYSGGLTIRTTIDLRFQRAADRSVASHVNPTDRAIGGLAMVQPGTGEVRALAQSRPMGSNKKQGQTYLNYVVPAEYGDANGFQAGSTFKVFVLASAIKQGVPLSTQIPSPPTISLPNNSFRTCDGNLASTDIWSPTNSTGSGTFDLYTRHPAVGEHLLRPARAAHRPVRTGHARPRHGHRRCPTRTSCRRSPSASPTPTR